MYGDQAAYIGNACMRLLILSLARQTLHVVLV